MKQTITNIVNSNKNAIKWLDGEKVELIELFENPNSNKQIYIINKKIGLEFSQTCGNERWYAYNRFTKVNYKWFIEHWINKGEVR